MSNRIIQPTSFNIDDPFEKELHEFAKKQCKYFSRYVKYLIEQHRLSKSSGIVPSNTSSMMNFSQNEDKEEEVHREAVKSFF